LAKGILSKGNLTAVLGGILTTGSLTAVLKGILTAGILTTENFEHRSFDHQEISPQ